MSIDLDVIDDTTPEDMVVALRLPPAPYALVSGSYLRALAQVEDRVASLKVTDAITAQVAADLQARLTRAGTELDKERKRLKAPFIEAGRAIDAAAAGPEQRINLAKRALQLAQTAWFEAEQKRIRDEERRRQAEIERLRREKEAEDRRLKEEADRMAKIAEEKRLADQAEQERIRSERFAEEARLLAAGRPIPPPPLDLGLEEDAPLPAPAPVKSEAAKALETALTAPAPVVAKPVGIVMRTTLEFTVVDVALLPEPFVIRSPDNAAIRRVFTTGWKEGDKLPELPGVTFTLRHTPVSSRQII